MVLPSKRLVLNITRDDSPSRTPGPSQPTFQCSTVLPLMQYCKRQYLYPYLLTLSVCKCSDSPSGYCVKIFCEHDQIICCEDVVVNWIETWYNNPKRCIYSCQFFSSPQCISLPAGYALWQSLCRKRHLNRTCSMTRLCMISWLQVSQVFLGT